jgi:long-chain acyl-CoA synthetase
MLNNIWLNKYPNYIRWDQHIEAKPAGEILNYAVQHFPENPAIDFLDKIIKYKELDELVNKAAKGLKLIGVKKGSKVGIYMPNCPYFVISYFAILKIGAVVVNFSPLYSENELEFQLEDSDTEFLITLNLSLLYPKASSLLAKSKVTNGKLKKIIVAKFADYLIFPKNILFKIFKRKTVSKVNYNEADILDWNRFLELSDTADINIYEDILPGDTAVIQYTGGTTGVPKGAELSHRNIYVNAVQSKIYVKSVPDGEGSILTVLPLFHVFAMTTAMNYGILSGAKLILHPRFEIEKVLKDIQNKKPTGMPGVPSMYNALNNCPETKDYDLTSLKVCVSGGGPLPLEVKQKFEKLTKCTLIEGYGLTETSPVVACNPVIGENKAGSIGLPFPNTEILIEDMENAGTYLGTGQRGELCIKGPQVMKGYYKREDATSKVLHNGILKTGDVAMVDEDGYIFIVDRIKEMIIAGGFKIYPRHVEEIIYRHPSVLECAVIGVKDPHSGEKPKAFIVLKKGKEKSKQEMLEYFKQNLAKHEVPKEIEFRDSLPKSPIGKILKKELR